MQLENGRPAFLTGRLDKEIRVYELLDRLGVAYERVDHAPAMTMEVCQEIDEVLHAVICKNLFLCNRQETAFYLLISLHPLPVLPHMHPLEDRFLLDHRILSRLCGPYTGTRTLPYPLEALRSPPESPAWYNPTVLSYPWDNICWFC